MKNVPILAKRDFMSRVKRPSYIITTLFGILVFISMAVAPSLLDYLAQDTVTSEINLLVHEEPHKDSFIPYLQDLTAEEEGIQIRAVFGMDETEAFRIVLEEQLTGLLLIDDPLFTLITPHSSNLVTNNRVEALLNKALIQSKIARLGLTDEEANLFLQNINLQVREVSAQKGQTHEQALLLTYLLLFMLYMALVLYGNMVASGVAEEKSSRIMEVMVSTVKPIELMFGKILGIGALGLLQFIIWLSTSLILSYLGRGNLIIVENLGSIPPETILWFGLYFLLGYFFYASIFAAAGALVSRVEEVNQVVTIFLMFIVFGFIAAFASFENPNGNFATITSLIPFTAPMVMFSRVVLASPPLIQIIASLVILLLFIFIGTWISAKIYHIGILLYGKRPSIGEVIRLLRD